MIFTNKSNLDVQVYILYVWALVFFWKIKNYGRKPEKTNCSYGKVSYALNEASNWTIIDISSVSCDETRFIVRKSISDSNFLLNICIEEIVKQKDKFSLEWIYDIYPWDNLTSDDKCKLIFPWDARLETEVETEE